ncbi:hypothetical protein ABD87_00260 [Lysinibacillus sphaericus]|uniref:S1 RNA-binding domain-containing protein n=1 Tax=Lysinibacillus sphaericus TaxID=1421 RepID=UPI0018CDF205|nr:hypothetical protein [Lysinibacillus sphaericus]
MVQNHQKNGYLIEGYIEDAPPKVNPHLIKLRTAQQNKMILQAEIVGIQEFPNPKPKEGETSVTHCAKLDYNGITGYIHLEEMATNTMTLQRLRSRVGTVVMFCVKQILASDHNDEIEVDLEPTFVASRKMAQEIAAETTLDVRKEGEQIKAAVVFVGVNHITVDVGGIESNIHVSECSHGWVDSLFNKFTIGNLIDVKILKIDKEKKSISVSHKATLPDAWETFESKFKVNSEYKCRVSGVTESGIYVNLTDGIDAYTPHMKFEHVNAGEYVLARIMKIDSAKRNVVCRIVRRIG